MTVNSITKQSSSTRKDNSFTGFRLGVQRDIISIISNEEPSLQPTYAPSVDQSGAPTSSDLLIDSPTSSPTLSSVEPTFMPSYGFFDAPSLPPTLFPSTTPSIYPSLQPSIIPSMQPSIVPSIQPSFVPSIQPSLVPSIEPSLFPSMLPTISPR
ncbi:hypothetical protein EON65_21630, partial [archaeon]